MNRVGKFFKTSLQCLTIFQERFQAFEINNGNPNKINKTDVSTLTANYYTQKALETNYLNNCFHSTCKRF